MPFLELDDRGGEFGERISPVDGRLQFAGFGEFGEEGEVVGGAAHLHHFHVLAAAEHGAGLGMVRTSVRELSAPIVTVAGSRVSLPRKPAA